MTAKEFKRARRKLGMSQYRLADQLGVTRGAVAMWETNRRPIQGPVQKLMRILVDNSRLEKGAA